MAARIHLAQGSTLTKEKSQEEDNSNQPFRSTRVSVSSKPAHPGFQPPGLGKEKPHQRTLPDHSWLGCLSLCLRALPDQLVAGVRVSAQRLAHGYEWRLLGA